jgi:hypothetical protein
VVSEGASRAAALRAGGAQAGSGGDGDTIGGGVGCSGGGSSRGVAGGHGSVGGCCVLRAFILALAVTATAASGGGLGRGVGGERRRRNGGDGCVDGGGSGGNRRRPARAHDACGCHYVQAGGCEGGWMVQGLKSHRRKSIRRARRLARWGVEPHRPSTVSKAETPVPGQNGRILGCLPTLRRNCGVPDCTLMVVSVASSNPNAVDTTLDTL